MIQRSRRDAGFTLMELVVVILILAILAGAIVPRVTGRMASARDARRLSDIKTVQAAVEQYYLDKAAYPRPRRTPGSAGWHASTDANGFLLELVETGYLSEPPTDPVNDRTYQYRYRFYRQGSEGCEGASDFYVLGVLNFETDKFSTENTGYFKCTARDWGNEFAFVTGGGATFKK